MENTFSLQSDQYAKARPRYPQALYEWIVSHCPQRGAVWDCATGNGQAAVDLAAYFQTVQATDVSDEQIRNQLATAGVSYSVQPAERTTFEAGSFDLITVAQALHWFDYEQFWPEVRRVARPGAFFCAWGYDWPLADSRVNEQVIAPLREAIAPYWAAQNRILWDGYQSATIAFPFQREPSPELAIVMHWSVRQLMEYLQTWSAYKSGLADANTRQRLHEIEAVAERLGQDGEVLEVRMPLRIVAGRVE